MKQLTKSEENFRSTKAALAPRAKKINSELNKVANRLKSADDARLAAAVEIAQAASDCKENNVPFKKWAEACIKQSWESVRKLRPIGQAEILEPGAGKKMLDEMRDKNKIANAEMRARKAEGSEGGESSEGGSEGATCTPQPAVWTLEKAQNEFQRIAAKLTEEEIKALAKWATFTHLAAKVQ